MRFDIKQEVKTRSAQHKRKRRWYKVVSSLAAVVVFCTTYALILPAITMENGACQLEEHTHTEACYVPFVEESWLELNACSLKEHTHTEACSADVGCGLIGDVDFIVHTHEDHCYDREGNLLCPLKERELHQHTAECYELLAEPEEETPVEEAPVEEAPVEEAPVEEAPVEEAPVEQTPVEEAPVEQTPVEQTPVEQTPVEQTPVEQTPVEQTPVEEAPVEEAPVEQTPVEEAPVEQTPVEESPTEETPVEQTPAVETYSLKSWLSSELQTFNVQDLLSFANKVADDVQDAIDEVTLIEEAPVEETPTDEIPVEEVSDEEAPAGEDPAEEAPAEEVPAEETPVEEVPNEEAPAEEVPVEETPVDEVPNEEAPAEETPAEKPSAEDPSPQCGKEELVLHTHSEACLDENGDVVCGKLQVIAHQHGEDCLHTVYSQPAMTVLECGEEAEESAEGHIHDESCYSYWMLGCGKEEHIHTEDCGILHEATLAYENDAVILTLDLVNPTPLPEDLSFELRTMSRADVDYAPYADHAIESAPGELRTLSAYEIVFFSAGEELLLPDAVITAELTVKELEIPEAEDVTPLDMETVEEAPSEELSPEELSAEEIPVSMMRAFSLRSAPMLLSAADETSETTESTEMEGSSEEETPAGEDDTAYQMHLTAMSSTGGSVSDADSAIVDPSEAETPIMFMRLGSSRTFALARSVEPLPKFEIHYLCNMLRYYTPTDKSLYLKIINTARTDSSHPVTGEPLGGLLPVNGNGTSASPNSNPIYNLYLEPSSTHAGYYRTAMDYELVEVYQAQENVIYSNSMTSKDMNVLRDNDHYGVTHVQTKAAGSDTWVDYVVNDQSRINDTTYVWHDVDDLYYFTNNPNAGTDDQDRKPIVITEGMTLRYIYFPTSKNVNFDANFFDYDISSGGNTNVSGKTKFMTTGRTGINSLSNYRNGDSTDAHLAFGNSNTASGWQTQTMNRDGVGNKLNQYNGSSYGKGYEGLTFGIVEGYVPKDDEGNGGYLVYNDGVVAPYLFSYGDGKTVQGKTAYSNTDMVFRRDGDTYTLTRVEGNDNIGVSNLELFQTTYKSTTKHLVSNSFWPFDSINNGGTHDYHFGGYGYTITCNGMDGNGNAATATAPISDASPTDAAVNHNSYFGVEFEVEFHLDGSYTGPLEYLFYGDDDMWVFLTDHQTGETHLIADIGGVHSSVGSYTDLWDWVPNTADRPNGKGDYSLHFFYTERGASGSSCYMQFTIPDAVGVPQQSSKTGEVSVEKLLASGMTSDEDFLFSYEITYPSGLSEAEKDRILPYSIVDADGQVLAGALFREGQFELKAGQKIIIGNIPVGSAFSVSEEVSGSSNYNAAWTTVPTGTTQSGDTVTGTIKEGGQTLAFECTNTYNSLTLNKELDVEAGFEVPAEFTFDILLTEADGTPLTSSVNTVVRAANGTYADPVAVTPMAGKITVTLKEKEAVTVYPLPDGAKYTITETDGGGLLPSWSDGTGKDAFESSTSGEVASGNVSVTCINRTYYELPDTGGIGTTLYTMGGLLMMTAAGLLGYKKKRKEEMLSS